MNDFVIRGSVTVILLQENDGVQLETLIDSGDLEMVQQFPGRWYAMRDSRSSNFYVRGSTPRVAGKQKTVSLHRWIMSAPRGLVVDHINHLTLDNRRENLRVVTSSVNLLNRLGSSKKNKSSGIRGVSWDSNSNKWRAHVTIRGKFHHLGLFENLEDAACTVEIARKELISNAT